MASTSTNTSTQAPVASNDNEAGGWVTPTRIALVALLLLCAALLYFRYSEAQADARAHAEVAMAVVEKQPSTPATGVDVAALSEAMGVMARPLTSVLAVRYCHIAQCETVYAKAQASACEEASSMQALCVPMLVASKPGDKITLSYDLTPAWTAAARDIGITVVVFMIVVLVWRQAVKVMSEDADVNRGPSATPSELDPLTGLLNRVGFETALKRHNETKSTSAAVTDGCLMYFDLDRFKIINDTHGHIAGDLVLKTVTQRLKYTLGEGVLIGRLGGDEFAALLTDVSSKANIEKMSRVLIEQVSKPIQLEGCTDWVGLSIGAFMLKRGTLSVGEMLHRADLAMYEAKRAGRGRMVFYEDAMSEASRSRAQIQADLKKAIEENQLFMVYQPQFDSHDSIRGVEAMVRWKHPSRGLIPPEDFMPVAEQTGLVVPLGKRIIELVCSDLVTLRKQNLALPYVSMDVSMRQLADSALVDDVQEALQRYNLTASDIEFEVTESTAMTGQVGKENSTLKKLSALAFRIAIDDFGTGYSSMGRLLDLKVDKLKIDPVFVAAIGKPHFDPALLELMISLANRLGVKSVAEGVETVEQVAWLRAAGCQMMQGNFYAKPMTHGQLIQWLKTQDRDNAFDDGVWAPTGTMDMAEVLQS
ncbi:MAG: bifunctional diguanylate cyclase/phosphodiesterase [Aquabacterium sp.]